MKILWNNVQRRSSDRRFGRRSALYLGILALIIVVGMVGLLGLRPERWEPRVQSEHADGLYRLEECLVRLSFVPPEFGWRDWAFEERSRAMDALWQTGKRMKLPMIGLVFASTRHPETGLHNLTAAYTQYCDQRIEMTRALVDRYAWDYPLNVRMEVGTERVSVETSGVTRQVPGWSDSKVPE